MSALSTAWVSTVVQLCLYSDRPIGTEAVAKGHSRDCPSSRMRQIVLHRMADEQRKDAFVGRASVAGNDDVENDLVRSLFLRAREYASLRERTQVQL